MLDVSEDILSLTDFKRNTAEYLRRLKRSRRPLVLTVNGKAGLVVLDPEAYQKLVEVVERAEAVAGIQRGLESFRKGKGVAAREALSAIKRKHRV